MKLRRLLCIVAAAGVAVTSLPRTASGQAAAADIGATRSNPVVIRQARPKYPPKLKQQRVQGRAVVDFLVMPDGTVQDAHAISADRPEFGTAAVEAVSHWLFKPGYVDGYPVAMRLRAPVVFQLTASRVSPIGFELGEPKRIHNIRTGEITLDIPVRYTGPGAEGVRAGRFILEEAKDDTGAVLKADGNPAFSHVSVGRTNGDAAMETSRQPVSIRLDGLGKDATAITVLRGKVESFIPAEDPDAMASIDDIASHWGKPVRDPALEAAGITLIVYDFQTATRMYANKEMDGPQDYDSGPAFGSDYLVPGVSPAVAKAIQQANRQDWSNYPPALAAKLKKAREMSSSEIAVGVKDPRQRLVEMEFQDKNGGALPYNHNGQYHAERTAENKHFDLYDIPSGLPPGAKLVCWILTDGAVATSMLKVENLALPEE